MPASEQVDVVVIGAGISGLAAAHWLSRKGIDVRVLEKESEPGGTMKTVCEEGYLVELGPNSALETTPLISQLVSETGLQQDFLYANPAGRNRYIVKHGKLHALPLSPLSFLTTPLFSASAKLRLLREPFIERATHEESIAEFVRRRLGEEFLTYAIDPFVAGIYAARPDMLSVRSAFPKLYALEERYGGLLRGMVRGRRERKTRSERSKDRAKTFSFRNGMQSFPRRIADGLGRNVLLSARVTGIRDSGRNEVSEESDGARFLVEYLHADRSAELRARTVILATPARIAASLLKGLSSPLARTLESVTYSPVASVFLGYNREDVGHALTGFGFLVPSVEQRRILGCLWSSSLFPGRAPKGHVGMTVFIGGGRQPELAALHNDKLVDLAASELKNIVQIRGKPVYWKCTSWPQAIPQYELGYDEKMKAVANFERESPGIFLCSNYRGGISVGDCIMSAAAVAQRAEEYLRRFQDR
jgi:oxygen-dependent protoporphyrinogen oxidase